MPVTLGLDPGIASLGFAAIDGLTVLDYGAITTAAGEPVGKRLSIIRQDITELVGKFKPDIVAIEQPFFVSKNTNAGLVLYSVGTILIALHECGYDAPIMVGAQKVKHNVTGSIKADKKQMKTSIAQLFGLELRGADDGVDAIGIAYSGDLKQLELAA